MTLHQAGLWVALGVLAIGAVGRLRRVMLEPPMVSVPVGINVALMTLAAWAVWGAL